MPCIVIAGSLAQGFEFFGPFPDIDAAKAFIIDPGVHLHEVRWIQMLIKPVSPPSQNLSRAARIVTAKRPGRRHGDER